MLHDRYRVLTLESSSIPNALAALLLHVRDATGLRPHIYFEWTEGNPFANFLRFFLFGQGEVAPVTREVLREAEPDRRAGPASTSAEARTKRQVVAGVRTLRPRGRNPSGRGFGREVGAGPRTAGRGGQGEHHGQAAAGGVLGGQGAAHGLGEAAGDREAEADSGAARGVAVALEGLEDPVLGLVGDAGAAVGDPELHAVGQGAGGDQHGLARRGCT